MKNVLITGVSTGIGYGTSKVFIENGYRVFGSVRKIEDAERLQKEFGSSFFPVIMDITDIDSIENAAQVIKKEIGDEGLAGLINNAGATNSAPLMHVPISTFRKNIEVLVIGQLAVSQAFLPMLGAVKGYKNTPGRILNVGSIYGKLHGPFMGNYITAKHAMEGLTRTLRLELRLYGIKVINVAPGIIKTQIWEKNNYESFDEYKETDYYPAYSNIYPIIQDMIVSEGFELDVFCKKMLKIFETKSPKFRYAIVKNKLKNWTIPRLISDKIMDRIIAHKIGL